MRKKTMEQTPKANVYSNAFTIYTAGPIDLGEDFKEWRKNFITEFALLYENVPVTLFDPSSAYKHAHWGVKTADLSHTVRAEYISKANESALLNADIMLVSLPAGVQSVGTILEMKLAKEAGVPMYLMTDIPAGRSAYLDLLIDDDRRFNCLTMDDLHLLIHAIVADVRQMGTRSAGSIPMAKPYEVAP
jgi:hypothetical protein